MRLANLLGALAFGFGGCCSNATLERAEARKIDLQSGIVEDKDPDAPAAEACSDARLVTLADLRRGVHEGELLAIDGIPVRSQLQCTAMLCTDACDRKLPCCNTCSGQTLRLVVPDAHEASVVLEGKGLRCSGSECAIDCEPFGPRPQRSYRFVGRAKELRASPGYFAVKLQVERWCHVPTSS